jgi:hypothetical protein
MFITLSTSAVAGFLDWDFDYKSVATQIPNDSGLAQIPYIGRNLLPNEDRTSAASHSMMI